MSSDSPATTGGPPVRRGNWLVVPTEAHVEVATRMGCPARTLRRLVDTQARLRMPERAPTTPEATRLLVAHLRDVPPAHAHALDQMVGALRRAGTSREALVRTGLPRGRYLAELLGDLDAALEARALYDDRSSPWLAASHVAHAPEVAPELVSGAAVVRGLTSWDNATLCFLEALHARLRRAGQEGLCLELPRAEGGPLAEALHALASDLEARWAYRADAPSLAFVDVAPLSADWVSYIEAHDAQSEARAVARAVLDAIAGGTPLDRVVIVPVDLDEAFLEPLRFELGRAAIPFAEPRGRPALASPRAHAAIELLRLARGPLGRDALIDVMRVPGLRFDTWFGEHRGVLGELLHEITELPLRFDRSGSDLTSELDDHLAELARDDPEHGKRLAPAREGLTRWLDELRRLAEPAPRPLLIARAAALFESLGIDRVSERTLARALDAASAGRPELLQALGHDAAGARALSTALERLSSAAQAIGADREPIALGTLLDELELALQGVSPTGGAVRAAAVRIARPRDIAGLDFDQVILCRASDASLDGRAHADSGLSAEIEARLPPSERPTSGITEQRFVGLAVAWALAGARRVTVTWAGHDGTRTLGPSRLARAIVANRLPGHSEPASSLVAGSRPAHRRGRPSEGARQRAETELRRIAFYANPNAPLDAENGSAGDLAAFFGGTAERPLAVTAIERALRCPYLSFTANVLRATASDPVEDAISARERGSLLHAALARALTSVQDLWGRRPPSELEAIARDAARALLEQRGRSPLRRAGLECTLLDVAALLRFVFDEDTDYRFALAEQAFGKDGPWPPLAIGDRFVGGRVDRVDVSGDGTHVRVVDYKTRPPSREEKQSALQPPLYAQKAALELGAQKVSFTYLALNRRVPKSDVVFEAPVDGADIQAGIDRTLDTLQSLEAGLVPPRPAKAAHCARCAARDICRRPLSAPEGSES